MMRLYRRIFAAMYDRANARAERRWLAATRAHLLARARGRVLEVGGGTGANLPYYRDIADLTVTEPDEFMRAQLAHRAAPAGSRVDIVDAGAESLPFPDGTFDTVVSTLVLCSVSDVDAALAEIQRVLRPEGELLFIEHVRANGRASRLQDLLATVTPRLACGCHPNRRSDEAIERAGFWVERQRFHPPVPLARLAPHVKGAATRASRIEPPIIGDARGHATRPAAAAS